MRGPIKWFGGKGKMVRKLLPLFPTNRKYIEVFGGGASLLFAKSQVGIEVYNDLDKRLFNFYSVLRDKKKFEEFNRLCNLTLYSRTEFNEAKRTLYEGNDIEQAWKFFIVSRMSFGGIFAKAWGYVVNRSSKNMISSCSVYLTCLDRLPLIHKRLQVVQIECRDFRDIFKFYDSEDAFFYVDPPYMKSTRKDGGYVCELSDEDHKELVEILLNLRGKFMLSGYDNELYKKLDCFYRQDFETACYARGRTRFSGGKKLENPCVGKGSAKKMTPRTENIWMNYQLQKTLF